MADGEANAALQTISHANNLFTYDIYRNLANGTDNLFFSPISIQVILALVFLGSRGDTAKQLARGLRLPEDRNVTENGVSALISQLQENNDVLLNIANRIFIRKGFEIKEDFNNSAIRFKAGTEVVDFSQVEQALEIINSWVEDKTNHTIKNIISRGDLPASTQCVLVNAIYFKSDWRMTFDKNRTSPAPFHVAPGTTKNINLMYISERFLYSEINELESQVLLLPYKGERIDMLLLLPRQQDGLPNLENKIASINLLEIFSRLSIHEVQVYLPKFKLEWRKDLKETLQTLGITDLFDGRANLTGISDESLSVSAVLHKAFIDVNEENTEASASTVVHGYTTGDPPLVPLAVFRADHPFVFLILDRETRTVLFAGRYSTPS